MRLDETALMAYQVSLEQTRAAISDRRGYPDEQSATASRGGCFRLIDHYIAPQQQRVGTGWRSGHPFC